ncbi:retrovirus-related pol polyprotein from transposon 17.6 [Tanacetum coccineum]
MTSTRQTMTQEALKKLISQRVTDALATYDANRNNGDDSQSHNTGSGGRRTVHTTRGATVGHDAAYEMPWKTLMKMMTENYCPRIEIKKLETKMVPDESDKVERYTSGLLDNIQGSVMASKPKILQEAIELAKSLMDQKVRVYVDRQADNKRRMDNNSRDNNVQQPSYKRQNVARAYSVRPSKKEYAETLPLCNKCKFYHNGPCTVTCTNCKRVGHFTRDCRSPTAANNQRTLTCFECGNQGHYRTECPKLKNQNRGNQAGSGKRVEGCMPWEEEKLTSPLSTLKMKPMRNEGFSTLA